MAIWYGYHTYNAQHNKWIPISWPDKSCVPSWYYQGKCTLFMLLGIRMSWNIQMKMLLDLEMCMIVDYCKYDF